MHSGVAHDEYRLDMKFTIMPQRNVLGTNVGIVIEAEGNESITYVTVESDGRTVSDEAVDPPEVFFQKDLKAVVGYTPGADHMVRVIVIDTKGARRVASHRWRD